MTEADWLDTSKKVSNVLVEGMTLALGLDSNTNRNFTFSCAKHQGRSEFLLGKAAEDQLKKVSTPYPPKSPNRYLEIRGPASH